MKRSVARKFVVLPFLALSLFFISIGAFAEEIGGTLDGGDVTYEQYLATSPEDTTYEAYMRWRDGRQSTNVIDCRSVCSDACAPHRTWYQYYVRDTCWW